MKYMDSSIKIFIAFSLLFFTMVHILKESTFENRKINLIDTLKKSAMLEWLVFMVLISLIGIKSCFISVSDNNEIISNINICVSFTGNITLITAVFLFILAFITLILSFIEIKEFKKDYIVTIVKIFLAAIIFLVLFIFQYNF